MKLQTVTRPLRWDETASLCAAVGWSPVDRSAVETGLGDNLFTICALEGERAVGCSRVVSDGGINFYIQHVIVMPSHQGRGIGGRIMDAIMVWLDGHAREGSFVGLRAAEGVSGFYEPYGFARRPERRPGMFRVW